MKMLSFFRMENALRQINPEITLPYWDLTLEAELDLPRESSIFTERFMGNGDGFVMSGPFRNWTVQRGSLYRTVGSRFSPMDDHNISVIFSQIHLADISYPYASKTDDNLTNFELVHNRVHNWVGGEMDKIETAADDPIFFIYHCFIDYVYEKFRAHQREHGVDPVTDWSVYYGASRHHLYSPMGLGNLMAGDGDSEVFARNVIYTEKPNCSRKNTDCGSPYLWCNVTRERCVPWTKQEFSNMEYVANQDGRPLHEELKVHIEDRLEKGFKQLLEMETSSKDNNTDNEKDNKFVVEGQHTALGEDERDTILVNVEIAMIVLVACLGCYAAFLITCKCVLWKKDVRHATPNSYNVNGHENNMNVHNKVISEDDKVIEISKDNLVSESHGNEYNLYRASQMSAGDVKGENSCNTGNPFITERGGGEIKGESPIYENMKESDGVSERHGGCNNDVRKTVNHTTLDVTGEDTGRSRSTNGNHAVTDKVNDTSSDVTVRKDTDSVGQETENTSLSGKIFTSLGTEFFSNERL